MTSYERARRPRRARRAQRRDVLRRASGQLGPGASPTSPTTTGREVDRVVLDMLAPWEVLDAVAEALVRRRRADDLRRHRDAAVADGRGAARAAVLDRAAGLGEHAARLARRRPGGAPTTHHARPHGVSDQRAQIGARGRRADAAARASASSADVSSRRCCAAVRVAPKAIPSPAAMPPIARRRRARRRHARDRRTPPRCRVRRGGAGPGLPSRRQTPRICAATRRSRVGSRRFCFSECTSPSSRSNSSQPIHTPELSGSAWRSAAGPSQAASPRSAGSAATSPAAG